MERREINMDTFIKNTKIGDEAIGHDRSEESTLILGPSGSGKSTLMAVLYECRMEAKQNYGTDGTGDIIIDGDLPPGMKIEHTTQAGTALPKKLTINDQCLWDTPGSGDSKGPQQELENAYYLRKILGTSSKCKLIFVTRHSHLESRAEVFRKS